MSNAAQSIQNSQQTEILKLYILTVATNTKKSNSLVVDWSLKPCFLKVVLAVVKPHDTLR